MSLFSMLLVYSVRFIPFFNNQYIEYFAKKALKTRNNVYGKQNKEHFKVDWHQSLKI